MESTKQATQQWQFWIDRGGTFTDIVACTPEGDIRTHKLLSESKTLNEDAALAGIRHLMQLAPQELIPTELIASVKMGTTVATNALLEHAGDPTVLVITQGFKDAIQIAYQNRPQLFALHIKLPQPLYDSVIEAQERYCADGTVLVALNEDCIKNDLIQAYQQGYRCVAIVLMHSYLYPQHEQKIAAIAKTIGFQQISVSHQVSPVIKLISRGDTTLVDAYLSPTLYRYIKSLAATLQQTPLFFMQSHGGLAKAQAFHGKDSILSGPAAGVIGAVATCKAAGFDKIISFDMGGTSTDVAHFAGVLERKQESLVAGFRLRAPMMHIHTVAAGGGSIVQFKQGRYQVGPESAGANPGPACYRCGGPLTITDCNVMLGRINPRYFPNIFGPEQNQPLDHTLVATQFAELAKHIQRRTHDQRSAPQVAEGFLHIAVYNMANAIKKISVQRGHDVTQYTLCCFGGAGGQHACRVADALGIRTIIIHPLAGVLSAYGLGLAELRILKEQALLQQLAATTADKLSAAFNTLATASYQAMQQQGVSNHNIKQSHWVNLRYAGSNTTLMIAWDSIDCMQHNFLIQFQQEFGYKMTNSPLVIESIAVETIGHTAQHSATHNVHMTAGFRQNDNHAIINKQKSNLPKPIDQTQLFYHDTFHTVPLFDRAQLAIGDIITGPAIIIEANSTTVVEPHWQAHVDDSAQLILQRLTTQQKATTVTVEVDPVMLEVFNNLFMSIAEQMGEALAKTAYSVNIKERLDFSCAIFDSTGDLVANAEHIPVHLGSMRESIQVIINERRGTMQPGDVYMLNNPYNGGTHLPDVTVITPVFIATNQEPLFYVASRAHHADIGGITPGSIPANSTHIEQEGILIDNFQLVAAGQFCETELHALLTEHSYPVRNLEQNIADLKAQIAANQKGVNELNKLIQHYGQYTVVVYMQHVQDNAEICVRDIIDRLKPGTFRYAMDSGCVIQVAITVNSQARSATIDFTGTSKQQPNNFNAPKAVCYAAVLYVFRTLIAEPIPLNQGCLKPLHIIIPDDCMLNPQYPAAIVAGNVETSQCIVDALYGALHVMAAAQGTMNNLTFGNDRYQYYETICGGSGAGSGFHGTSGVHTHMTNSLLTDPEILEQRFPVHITQFGLRANSGGSGRWHGGNGVIRHIHFRQAMTVAMVSNRRHIAPYGMAGGQPGQVGCNILVKCNGERICLDSTFEVQLQSGDSIVIKTPGGGGYGPI